MSGTNRVVAITDYLISVGEPKRLTEISKELRISNSTAYRILSSLKRTEWVMQNRITKTYSVGNGLLELAISLVTQLDLRKISLPYLETLNRETRETALLSMRVDLERMDIEQMQGDHEVRQIVELGKRLPLWLGAVGKGMLAYMEEREIKAVIDNSRHSRVRFLASGQRININKLRKELAEIRKQGFSVTCGERVPGTTGVAAPIFSRDHLVVGAISVGGPVPRFSMDVAVRCSRLVSEAAKEISLQLGDFREKAAHSRER
jgi:DNA-binding IclR family transcriptional regulator